MQIVAAAGLAQKFVALRSLTTTNSTRTHEMHLMNILNQHQATKETNKSFRLFQRNNGFV